MFSMDSSVKIILASFHSKEKHVVSAGADIRDNMHHR